MNIARELKQTIAELELISEVSAVSLDPSSRDSGEDIGGKRPPGGVDRKGDREREWTMKSAEHFRRRAANAVTSEALRHILVEARAALELARRRPSPQDAGHPMPGDHDFKRWVAESELPSSEVARLTGKSGQYIRKIRALYRERTAA